MNQPADGYAAQLGTHADWGLTRESFTPLRDELADHLHCLSENSGPAGDDLNPRVGGTGVSGAGAPARDPLAVASKLTTPKARRALTSTRIADQVYATLHRWPTRSEWRELGWLMFWYVLMIASDVLAFRANASISSWRFDWISGELPRPESATQALMWSAWLLQGIARAGFFSAFGISLFRAWRVGSGVLIARLLQLKLIHVVLVILGGLGFTSLLWLFSGGVKVASFDWFDEYAYFSGPAWLTAPAIAISLVVIGVLLVLTPRLRPLAASSFLLAFFLFPGGPLASHKVQVVEPWLENGFYVLEDGTLAPAWNPTHRLPLLKGGSMEVKTIPPERLRGKKRIGQVENTVATRKQYYSERDDRWKKSVVGRIDVLKNTTTWSDESLISAPTFHVRVWDTRPGHVSNEWLRQRQEKLSKATVVSESRLQGPVVAVGAGLGWMAAPIPILTAIGLLLLVAVMGRRSPAAFLLYTVLAAAAMILTVTPFFVGQRFSQLVHLNPEGVVHSPFPGFEMLMLSSWHELASGDLLSASVLLGLLFSSGIPWLLTAMFLKPTNTTQPSSGPELAG